MAIYHLDGQARELRLTSRFARRAKQALFASLALVSLISPREGHAQQDTFDRDSYYRAVDLCRGTPGQGKLTVNGPMALSTDGQILCFDGSIAENMDVSLAKELKENGLFVVRSSGGYSKSAIELSDIVRDRHATVVVHGFCFSACANYFLIASYQTYVLQGTLVVWHNSRSLDAEQTFCNFVTVPRDGGPRKLRPARCQDAGPPGSSPILRQFFKNRAVDPWFEAPADSFYVRKIVRSIATEMAVYRDIGWTLHPRYYPRLFKTKIFYEAYPESQNEVDDMLARLHLQWKVIYDP